jgi:hypothetical protein
VPGETGSSKEALLSMRCLVLGDIRDVGDEDVDTDNFLKGLWSRKLLRPLLRFGERFFRMSNMFKRNRQVSSPSGFYAGAASASSVRSYQN